MLRIAGSAVVVFAISAFAQTVTVGGTGGVEVKKANGETVTVGGSKGTVQVKTKKGTTTVQQGSGEVTTEAPSGATVKVRNTPPPANAPAAAGSAWSVADNGQALEHTCVDGERITVMGNTNTITLHGPCESVSVSGNKNKVIADVVGAIEALGNENTVSWRAALKGAKPRVSSLGIGNTVSQQR